MDSPESISSCMDTTTDSIDVVGHFNRDAEPLNHLIRKHHQRNNHIYHRRLSKGLSPRFKLKRHSKRRQTIFINGNNLDYHDEKTISNKLPPDKQYCIVDETPPSSTSSATTTNDFSPSQQQLSHLKNEQIDCATSSTSSSIATFMSCYSGQTQQDTTGAALQKRRELIMKNAENNPSPGKKTVLFDKVTVYHFNRSQGFTSIPTEGGATLGMKRRHFLRRRLSVDLYEEVRRRSRRQILLKIHIEKKKKQEEQQKAMTNGLKNGSSSSSQANTPDSDDNNVADQTDTGEVQTNADQVDKKSDNKVIDVEGIGEPNDEEEDDETYSDFSDISDSELESDSNIFLQPLGVKLRRSLLRASGVCRIDPVEKRDCKKIRDSRERSGCKCVGQCIPQYCECSRLGVRCHVDRASFPCGCNSEGCKNPEGRTEFDSIRVRKHFEEKIMESLSQLSSNEDEPIATTPPSSTTSEESC